MRHTSDDGLTGKASADCDAPGGCVLDGIADQVHENLSQVRRIGAHSRQRRADGD